MDFLAEENAMLRDTLKRIIEKIIDSYGNGGFGDCADGWDSAITEILDIISEESGVTIDEILQSKCN